MLSKIEKIHTIDYTCRQYKEQEIWRFPVMISVDISFKDNAIRKSDFSATDHRLFNRE